MEHTARLTIALSLVMSAALMGCSDYQLSKIEAHSPEPEPTSGQSSGPIETPRIGTGGSTSEVPSPWGALEPGQMPEEYFAVAWVDPSETDSYSPPRYDIIDISGQVVSSFSAPEHQSSTNAASWVSHHSLQASGPGRFLAVTSSQAADFYGPSTYVWSANGFTGEQEILISWGPFSENIELPQAGIQLELPDWFGLQRIVADPHNEDRLFVLTSNTMMYSEPLLGTLYSIHVRDPQAEVLSWDASELISPDLIPEWVHAPWDPWMLDSFARGDETVLALGLQFPDEEGGLRTLVAGFSPENGPTEWSLDLSDYPFTEEIAMVPSGDEQTTSAVFHQSNDWCPSADFVRWDGGELTEFSGTDSVYCSSLGPVLDDSAETFIYYGYIDPDLVGAEQRAFISHRGADVWSYSRFREGLQEHPFEIVDIARLQLEQE